MKNHTICSARLNVRYLANSCRAGLNLPYKLDGVPSRAELLREKGLTIVELMVGIIIVSVLTLTIGSMLYYTYLSWFRNRDTVELQRDGTIAMDMIARAIRPHKGTVIGATNGGSTLIAGGEKFDYSFTTKPGKYMLKILNVNSQGSEVEEGRVNVTHM